jgi:5-methylcytosine-specific restriction enzyme subunit McrC
MKTIDVYEYGRLIIDDKVFKREHWKSFVKLNDAHEGQYFDVLHNGLRFKQFVGVIQVDGLLVQIHPKSDKDDEDGKWRDVLLQMLKACGRVKAQTAGEAQLSRQNLNLLEVYFEYFLREVEQLIHQGLVKKYRKETGNVKALKGKLDFAGNIRYNLVHKERFYTTHQVYDANHRLHQVLALALEIVDVFSRGTRLNDRCKRVKLAFPEVDTIRANAALLESIKLDRKTAPYGRAFDLAKLIILNYSPDINQGKNKMIALLFDMNQLWEEYVLVMLRKEIYKNPSTYSNFTIHGQKSKYFWGYNKLKPDIVIEANNRTFIIDTKWKRPGYSASVEDLRQVYTYARFWDAENVMLLYPGNKANDRNSHYATDDYRKVSDDKENGIKITHVAHMAFVNVLKKDPEPDKDGILRSVLNEKLGEEILGNISFKD